MTIASVFDCGANEGQFGRVISAVFPDAKLYCFAPLEEPYGRLSAWAKTQNGRVQCFKFALGDEQGEAGMHRHDGHTPSSLLISTKHCCQFHPRTLDESLTKVRLTTLDQALEGHLEHMPRGILLKRDVQGFEDRGVRGAAGVSAECLACMLEVSLDPLYEGQPDLSELARLLIEAGFRYAGNLDQVYAEDGRVVYLDAAFLRGETI